jgi:hypothetical protein
MSNPGIVILLAIVLAVGVYSWQRDITRRKAVQRFNRSMGDHSVAPASPPLGKVDRQTQAKLIRLLGGNQKTINRLLEQSRFKNSDRPEQWHWEKVLYDLERDRWR